MDSSYLPNIGDIITFSGMWHDSLSLDSEGVFPNGIVTSIVRYNNIMNSTNSSEFMGTLAYPITISNIHVESSIIYVVQWATTNPHIMSSYRLINEEWFYNDSFRIVSRV